MSRTFTLPADTAIHVEATAGEIRVSGRERADISVEIITEAPTARLLATLEPQITQEARALRIVARQARGGMDPAVRSTIVLGVPRAARLESIKLLTGRVILDDLNGRVSAGVTRGTLSASRISGTVRLETGTGDLTCEHARLSPDGLLRLRAFNGQVTLQLDEKPPDARILAMSFNGRIMSEIPLQMKDRFGPRFGEATLGKGEPLISIDTVTGDIAIKVGR